MTPLPKHLEEMRDEFVRRLLIKQYGPEKYEAHLQSQYKFFMEDMRDFNACWNQAASIMLKDMESMAKALEKIRLGKCEKTGLIYGPYQFEQIAEKELKNYREKYDKV